HEVRKKVERDAQLAAALAEYNSKRAQTPNTADAQWRLGVWCEEHALKPESQAHFATVVRLDPSRDAAWKRLGCRKQNGRWVAEAQIAAERAELDAQKQADKKWVPLLERYRSWLATKDKAAEAKQALAAVTETRAVPAVFQTFGTGNADQQR